MRWDLPVISIRFDSDRVCSPANHLRPHPKLPISLPIRNRPSRSPSAVLSGAVGARSRWQVFRLCCEWPTCWWAQRCSAPPTTSRGRWPRWAATPAALACAPPNTAPPIQPAPLQSRTISHNLAQVAHCSPLASLLGSCPDPILKLNSTPRFLSLIPRLLSLIPRRTLIAQLLDESSRLQS